MTAPLFPIFANLQGRRVLVVGGGAVAARKTKALLDAGARVRVGAPELNPALAQLAQAARIEHSRGEFQDAWLDEVWLAVAATNDVAVNRAVVAAGEARRIWVNVVDDAQASNFHVPAAARRCWLDTCAKNSKPNSTIRSAPWRNYWRASASGFACAFQVWMNVAISSITCSPASLRPSRRSMKHWRPRRQRHVAVASRSLAPAPAIRDC